MPVYAERYHQMLVSVTVKTSVTVHELRDFTKADWCGYAGCEADKAEPVIFELEFSKQHAVIFVADDNGIGVDYILDGERYEIEVYTLELAHPLNRMVISAIHKEFHDNAHNYTTWPEVKSYLFALGFGPI